MNTPGEDKFKSDAEIERLRLKSNLKEKLLGRALQESEDLISILARKQEELCELNSRLENAKDLLKQSFQRYVSAEVVEQILESSRPVDLLGERKILTIMFSDIRGFTSLAEQFDPEELVRFLNSYLSEMIDIIFQNEGTLDKFMGDAILAFFGAPISFGDDALRAVRAAIAMQRRLSELNQEWQKDGRPRVKMGIGISTGEVIVGNIGSEKRMEYTVIGQHVNYAQRIEGLTKEIPYDILIGESTYNGVRDSVSAEPFGPLSIDGIRTPMTIYGIDGSR
jgi:class 3 adenylate cyclase